MPLVPERNLNLSANRRQFLSGGGEPRVTDAKKNVSPVAAAGGGGGIVASVIANHRSVVGPTGGGSVETGAPTKHESGGALLTGGGTLGALETEHQTSTADLFGGGEIFTGGPKAVGRSVWLTGGGEIEVGDAVAHTETVRVAGGGELLASGAVTHTEPAKVAGGGDAFVSGATARTFSAKVTGGGEAIVGNARIAGSPTVLAGGGGGIIAGATKTSGSGCDYRSAVLADSPTSYWRLDEPSGATAFDQEGAHDGTYVGSPVYAVPGATYDGDKAVEFDALNTQMQVPFSAALNTAVFSIEAWVKPINAVPNQTFVVLLSGAAATGYRFQFQTGATPAANLWTFVIANSGGTLQTLRSPVTVTPSGYAHLVGTYDGTTARFYVNGSLISALVTTFQPNVSRFLSVGESGTSAVQVYDEVAYYPTVLTAAQIANHYNVANCSAGVVGGGGDILNIPTKAATSVANLTGGGSESMNSSAHRLSFTDLTGGGSVGARAAQFVAASAFMGGGGNFKTCLSTELAYADTYLDAYGTTVCPAKHATAGVVLGDGGELYESQVVLNEQVFLGGGGELLVRGGRASFTRVKVGGGGLLVDTAVVSETLLCPADLRLHLDPRRLRRFLDPVVVRRNVTPHDLRIEEDA